MQHRCSLRAIAQLVGCSNSTVSREIRRNSSAHGYCPEQAQRTSANRRQKAHKASKRAWSLMIWVSKRLREYWSPGQIIGFMRRVGSWLISHQWIYELIYRDKAAGGDLWRYCRQPGRRRYQRHLAKRAGLGRIPNRVGIEQRPGEVDRRQTLGHWEGDTVLHGHKQSGLVTLVERRSGYLLAERLVQLKARPTAEAIIRQFRPIRGAVRTLTLDNGFE
ncbi:IS30 family transposase, partial [Halovibrio salipaludis]